MVFTGTGTEVKSTEKVSSCSAGAGGATLLFLTITDWGIAVTAVAAVTAVTVVLAAVLPAVKAAVSSLTRSCSVSASSWLDSWLSWCSRLAMLLLPWTNQR